MSEQATSANLPSLAQHIWLKAPETRSVLDALRDGGAEVRFVGGSVRNALIGEAVTDIDLATTAQPAQVIEMLEAAGIKAVPTGVEHGTVTAVVDHRAFEITTLRTDIKAHGRHADVEFTEDWNADAERRDFTMNALYADPDGDVHDPLGGYDDLKAGRVRFIGDATARIKEDYLRILRFFRMHAWYGKGELDAAGLQACVDNKDGLARLSAERIRDELLKLMAAPRAGETLRVMAATNILSSVLPEATRLERFETVAEIESQQLFVEDPIRRLAAVTDLDEAGVRTLAERLRLSNKDRDRLIRLVNDRTKMVCYLSMREVRRALYLMGVELFKDRAILSWAEDPKASNAIQWRALVAMADSWVKPELPLSGKMVKAAGVPDGPEVGRVMREVEEWWIDSDFIDDEFSIIERLKAIVQATVY